jgi:NRPS condensation-like uncharacterized protein
MASALKIPSSVQDWFFVAISLGHDQTIRLVMELDGQVDLERLRHALRRVLEAEPVLQCRFVPGLFRAWWRSREDVNELEMNPSHELCRFVPTDDPQGELHAFMAVGIDPYVDPLVQIGVFRSGTDTLCIKVSHVAMDGGGLKKLVERLTRVYRALAVDPSAAIPLDLALDRGQGQVLKAFPLHERLRAFLTQPFHEKRWHFPFLKGTPGDITFSERSVRARIPDLKLRARAHGANLTDLLLTGFVRAIFALTETPRDVGLPFTVAIDLRRYHDDPGSLGLCNLSSLAWFDAVHRDGESFAQTLAAVHDSFALAMARAPGVGLAMVMEIVSVLGYRGFIAGNRVRIRLARREGREFPSLSNIGLMDPAVMDFGGVAPRRARFWGPVLYPPTFYLVTGTFGDEAYFSAAYPRNLVPGDLVETLLDRIVSEIDSLA